MNEMVKDNVRRKIKIKKKLRYNPFDTARLFVYQEGKQTAEAMPVKKVENAQRKRQTNIYYAKMDGGGGHV